MNIYSLIPLVAVLAYIPLLIIIINSRPWQRQHQFFVVYLVAAMAWSLSSFLMHSNFLMEDKLLLAKLNMCTFVLMGVQLYLFSRSFGQGTYVFGIVLGYILLAGTIILAVLGYAPQSVTISDNVVVSIGIWLPIIFVPLALLMADNIVALLRKFRSLTDQMQRTRITYILIGVCIMGLFSFSNAIEFLRRFPVDHFGNLTAACLWTYATVRYRIVDVRFIARRGLAWVAVIAVGVVAYVALYSLFRFTIGVEERTGVFALVTFAVIITGMAVYQLQDLFAKLVDRLFYGEGYDYRQKLIDFIRYKLSGIFSLKDLGTGLLPLIVGSLHCQRACLLLPELAGDDFVAEFAEPDEDGGSSFRIGRDSPIVEWLRRENRYLTRDRLDILPEFRSLRGEEKNEIGAFGVELFFPLISRGNLIGLLLLGKRQSGRYPLEDINLVESITSQVAVTMEKEYLQEQLKKREQELTLINQLDRVITSSLDIQEVYDAFAAVLRDVVDVDWASITLIDKDEIQFGALSTEVGSAWQAGERIPLKGTATEWVTNNKRALVIPDLAQESKFWTGAEFIKLGIRSIVYVPLVVKGTVIGCLVIASRRPEAYPPEQVRLLESLALQIAVSVENSRLYAKAEQRARVDELTRLFNRRHFDESLRREISLQSRYGGVLSLVFLDLDVFKDYNDRYGHPEGDKILAKIGSLIEKSIRSIDLAFRYGGDEFVILLPQAASKDALVVAERVREVIGSEMKKEQSSITASLGLASWPSDGVTSDDIVTAADRALYYAKRTGGNRTCVVSEMLSSSTEQATGESKTESEALNIIYALASTIEARDQYTYGHSRNVSKYAVALAESLGLPSEKAAVIGAAGLLHDIGKIGVPDEVLNKAGKLNSEEWDMIKSHPRLSAAIVGHVLSLTPCLPAILYHQGRWDGTGYPSGLKGEAIPLEARILTIADAFEAMTSPRPYRGPMSGKEALEELKRGAGRQFDPKLVADFIPIALAIVPDELGAWESIDDAKAD